MGKGWGGDGGREAFPGADNHLSAVIAPPKTILDDHTLTLFQVLPACLAGWWVLLGWPGRGTCPGGSVRPQSGV